MGAGQHLALVILSTLIIGQNCLLRPPSFQLNQCIAGIHLHVQVHANFSPPIFFSFLPSLFWALKLADNADFVDICVIRALPGFLRVGG